jgi:hypothetical protein
MLGGKKSQGALTKKENFMNLDALLKLLRDKLADRAGALPPETPWLVGTVLTVYDQAVNLIIDPADVKLNIDV